MKTEIDSRKIIVNIQLYANKIGDLKPYTYGEVSILIIFINYTLLSIKNILIIK